MDRDERAEDDGVENRPGEHVLAEQPPGSGMAAATGIEQPDSSRAKMPTCDTTKAAERDELNRPVGCATPSASPDGYRRAAHITAGVRTAQP
jgi:hypothetical protein